MPRRPVKTMPLFVLSVEAAPVDVDVLELEVELPMSIPPVPAVLFGATLPVADFAFAMNLSMVLPVSLEIVRKSECQEIRNSYGALMAPTMPWLQ